MNFEIDEKVLDEIEKQAYHINVQSLISELEFIEKKYPIKYITLFGFSGSGKTNTSFRLYEIFYQKLGYQLRYFDTYFKELSITRENQLLLDEILNTIKNTHKPYAIFDDMSFLFMRYKNELSQFLNELMKIRHTIQQGVFVFITHYKNAILPIFRTAQIYILTSLMLSEINTYAKYFTYDSLYRFYNLQTSSLKHYVLLNVNGKIYITEIELSQLYQKYFKFKSIYELGA